MAICYANNGVIHAEDHVGVLRSIAYAGRCAMRCPISGKTFDWSHLKSDVLFRQVLLPDSAPEHFKDPPRRIRKHEPEDPAKKTQRMSRTLWRAVDQSERVFDRKAKVWRFRKRGQLAYRLILAVPAKRPLDEVSQLVVDFVQEQFVEEDVPAEAVIHKAEDEAGLNVHAHVTIGTRVLGPDGFGLKARHLLPDFVGHKGKRPGQGWTRIRTGHEWPRRWMAFQNEWYRRRGIDLQVDPIAAEPGIHIGKWRDPEIEAERRAAEEAKRIESAKIARDPERLLRVIEDQMPVFGLRDVLRHLRRNGVMGFEARQIAHRLLTLPEIVALEPQSRALGIGRKLNPSEARLYTTKSILEQEKRIRSRVEYLYGQMVWGRPLPAGMKAYAQKLSAERKLDLEQAEAVMHAIEGPGIRVTQGVAGAGKTYLLETVRMVYKEFGFKVVAMAPTNLVAADLRKNGFDASTLHRFISDVRSRKRTLGPDTVLIVDEAGMVGPQLYNALTEIACKHGCRLILSGDDRQLPPIGRGGMYSKIRHMIGDARLSRVRRQNADWMKAASESLSTWDIAAGVEAYAARDAIKWSTTREQAMIALVEQCARDLDQDPQRDLSKLAIYCSLNQSADLLNNEIQARIWRTAPPAANGNFTCCRGSVRIRTGDRVQFFETDLKKGLFNGAIGTVSDFSEDAIHVRLDSGEDVAFDPREFKGWGLGYAGTVHRGQGQTKQRSYVLYDHPYLWNAALTYVALTRHRESTALFVPRELAEDQAALIDQMSRVTDQPLASDYAVLDPARAGVLTAVALYPLQPPVQWTIVDIQGQPRVLDLNLEEDAEEARSAFRRMPAPEFAIVYSRLRSKSYDKPSDHPYHMLQRSAEMTAMVRGFKPGTGSVDPDCLMGLFRNKERKHHVEHVLLQRETGKMDVSAMVIDPNQVEIGLWRSVVHRLRQLDEFVRDAIRDRLNELRARARPDSTISAALGAAQFVLRLCGITPSDAAPSSREIKAAMDQEGAPRQVFGSLKLWRKVGPDDYEPVLSTNGIQYAFGGKPLPLTPAAESQQPLAPQRAVPHSSPIPNAPSQPATRLSRSAADTGPRIA